MKRVQIITARDIAPADDEPVTCTRCGIRVRPIALTEAGKVGFAVMMATGLCAPCRADVNAAYEWRR